MNNENNSEVTIVLTTAEKRGLFEDLTACEDETEALVASLKDAKKRLSDAAQKVLDKCGKGPFRYNGRLIRIVRSGRGGLAHVRGERNEKVEEI